MKIEELPDVLTPQHLIDFLPIGRNSVYDLLKTNKIKSIKVGRKNIIPKQYLLDYLFADDYNGSTHLAVGTTQTLSLIESEVTQ